MKSYNKLSESNNDLKIVNNISIMKQNTMIFISLYLL